MEILVKIPDEDLIKYLGDSNYYLLESIELTTKQDKLIEENINEKNTEEILKNFKRLNEIVVIYEFLKSKQEKKGSDEE